ncbi:MAG: serine/threonine-protein kinase, partial [Polyangiales bacterium]
MPRSSAPVPPQKLGRYDVLRRLGAGGMAEVYLGRSRGAEGTQKLVVLKRVLPSHSSSGRMRTMFVDEARLSMRLNHPNIVQVFDFQETTEGFLLCMEYVEGLDLGRLMSTARSRGVRLPPWVGAYIVMEAARGLHNAHERKGEDGAPLEIVHRDVSPQNVLISYEGAVKVADFGIASAKILTEETGVLKGKFAYMSPEQAKGEPVDRRTDIYALGIVLHEILTGKPLYAGVAGDELLEQVRKAEVEAPSMWASEVPTELDAICMRALSKKREDRFASARDMAGAIARVLQRQDDLVDAAAVEATISQFSAREITSPGQGDDDAPPPPPSVGLSQGLGAVLGPSEPMYEGHPGSAMDAVLLTAVAVPSAAAKKDASRKSLPPTASTSSGSAQSAAAPQKVQRELRHVALVHLKIQGFEELAIDLGAGALAIARERAKNVLDGIAFKRGARWTWDEDEAVARAVVGLTANPSGAPYEAAALAL